MPTPEQDPFAEVSENARLALVRLQQARQSGDEMLIEIATNELAEAKAALDAALDEFERTVLGGHFSRKRDLPKAGVSKYHPNPLAALAAAKRAKRRPL